MTQANAIALFPPVPPEDQARADMYALLSRLFYAAPDEALLRVLATAEEISAEGDDDALAAAWRELREAAALADVEEVRFEYDNIFVGTGKAEVTPYSTAYLAGVGLGGEKQLAALRDELAQLGVARQEGAHEPEDHISALCDVMRFLIMGDPETPAASLDRQRAFFQAHIEPWFPRLADAIGASERADFYRPAGLFLRAFLQLERESLLID